MNTSEATGTQYNLTPLDSGAAGALSSFITRAILHPLDVLKIRFQLQVESTRKNKGGLYNGIIQATRTIFKNEGASSLWKGHMSAQALTITYGIGQFGSLTFFKKQALNFGFEESGMVITACGGLAGLTGTLVSMPFDVARTRMIAQSIPEYSGMFDVWRKMLRKENLFCLWRGLTPTLLMTVPFAAIQFRIYYYLSSIFSDDIFKEANIMEMQVTKPAMCGAVAGVCAKALVHPLDVLKKRIQIKGSEEVRHRFGKIVVYANLWDCIRRVTVEEGFFGWFKGLKPSLIKSASFSAFVFTFYELSCDAIRAIKQNDQR